MTGSSLSTATEFDRFSSPIARFRVGSWSTGHRSPVTTPWPPGSRAPLPEAEHIVVVGAMGSGKSTLARALAEALERVLFDSDRSIQERTGHNGREIAQRDGVEALHRLEKEVLLEPLEGRDPAVVAAAASVIDDPAVRDALQGMFCVWVTADPEILAQRSARGAHRRPVGKSEHLERRDPLFQQVADLVVDTGVLSEREALDMVLGAMWEDET